MKKFPKFKSRNLTIFFYTALILAAFMLGMFVYIINFNVKANVYMAFSFVWLSVIISVCFYYLSIKQNEVIKQNIELGILIYDIIIVMINIIFFRFFKYYFLILVDFIAVFGILIYGMIVYIVNKKIWK